MTSRRPRVAIDAHTIGRRATGNETYVRGLIAGLAAGREVDQIVLVNRDADTADLPAPMLTRLRARHPIPRLLGQLSHSRREWGVDLLHVQYVRPIRSDVPVVTTIHDISFEHFPHLFTRRSLLRMRTTIPWSARASDAVLTGSNYSRDDLIERYRLSPERVFVTAYAADSIFFPQPPEAAASIRDSLGLPSEYILYVGNLQPRKNLARLIEAFVALHAGGLSVPLVIVGKRAWLFEDIFATVRSHGLGDTIYFTGYVPRALLPAVYTGALAFAYPSLFEGFGIPVLEALACGIPTLTSTASSLPEVAGDAAILVDPTDVDAIRTGLERLLCDQKLQRRLRIRGPQHAARFSWERCAAETVRAYRTVL